MNESFCTRCLHLQVVTLHFQFEGSISNIEVESCAAKVPQARFLEFRYGNSGDGGAVRFSRCPLFRGGAEMPRLEFGRGDDQRLQSALASGAEIAVLRFGRDAAFTVGEVIQVETPTRERFVIEISGCDFYPLERVPEEFAREAGFVNGFSLQFVLRNLGATEVTVVRFRVVKYLEYDH